jgi:hypothetical protein
VGSRLKINQAYIAGFLDGDGSLMLQLKRRSDTKSGIRFMATICFYQDSRHDKPLKWMKDLFGIGYLAKRNDGMTELRINGHERVGKILKELLPFLKFKERQARSLIKACEILSTGTINKLGEVKLKKLVELMIVIQNENYKSHHRKTKTELYKYLSLTP